MDDKTVIKEYFDSIDSKLQQLLISPVTKNKIEAIIQKYPLRDEQGAQLKNEIQLVLIGMEVFSNFRANLVQELGITYDQALKLAYDVNEQIFSGVMNELKEMESDIAAAGNEGVVEEGAEKEREGVTTAVEKNTADHRILQRQTETTTPDHMIADHQSMETTDGPHLHSQTVMPQRTIVDEKLSQIVRPTPQPAITAKEIEEKRKERYRSNDPYREPIE